VRTPPTKQKKIDKHITQVKNYIFILFKQFTVPYSTSM